MRHARSIDLAEASALLDWYRAAGVDLAVGEEPVDRFALSKALPRNRAAPLPAATPQITARTPQPPPATPSVLVPDLDAARALANAATTLDELKAAFAAYDGCALKASANQLVFSDGNPEAQIMLVGEAPGAEEDREGKPFVGRAGQLLDRMLAAIGLDRTKVYIANTVSWRPPGNRNPAPQEIAACQPFLHRQIELVAPKILLTLGNVPTQSMFSTTQGITRLRGQWRALTVNGHEMRAMASFHPAFLLRNPVSKREAWSDMLSLKAEMAQLGIG